MSMRSEPSTLTGDTGAGSAFQRWRSGRRRSNNPMQESLLGYLFIAPALLLYLTFNIWPLVRGILMAFTDYRFVYPETRWAWNGFENFTKLANSSKVQDSLVVTFKYTLIVVPLVLIVALLTAFLISRVQRGAAVYRWVIYLPAILPIAVSFLMFKQLYGHTTGLINSLLRDLGVADPPHWLGEVATALPAIAISHAWIIFGFPTILFLIGIYNIGEEMYEAASLDGAGRWKQFLHITLPQLKPTIALVLILVIPGVFGTADPILLLTQGGPQASTRTLGYYLYTVAFQIGDLRLGYASASSLVVSLITAFFVGIVFWWSKRE